MRKLYLPTEDIDRKIRGAYYRQRQGDRSALTLVRRELGWSKSAVVRRGAALCLTRAKEHSWSAAEEDLLAKWGHLGPAAIQRRLARAGYQRSCAAIQVKLVRLRIKRNLDGYSACTLAHAFGVDVHRVSYWIRRGLLRAHRRGTDRTVTQGGDMWWIPLSAVRQFIMRAPEEIDLARVEKFWFLDLLTGGKICR
jgi:hypothetical protein